VNALTILADMARQGPSHAIAAGPPPEDVPTDGERIAALPVADYADPDLVAYALEWATEKWWIPGSEMRFRPVQALALLAIHATGGAILPIGVGHGKTLVSLLAAEALGTRRAMLLIPPAMRYQLDSDVRTYGKSFRIPRHLRIVAYSQLSQATSTDMLERLQPDALIMDEAHNLRHAEAARTKRVIRYLRAHPNTRVVAMSGTLTGKSLKDYAHLASWALKKGSPLPLEHGALASFCTVLDAKPVKEDGAARYEAEPMRSDWNNFAPLFPEWKDCDPEVRRDEARARFHRRLVSTPGVVTTSTASVGASLYFKERAVEVPPVVRDAIAKLEETWTREDGEELMLALDVWRLGVQLGQGFYYRWKWPDGEPDTEWLELRAAWHREVRRIIGYNRPHLDSPLLVTNAVRNGTLESPSARAAWSDWTRVMDRPTPPTETVWLDDFLVDDAMRWLEKNPRGLVWYAQRAFAEKLAERAVPVFGGGTAPPTDGRRGMALSIAAHGTGKNLQAHSENLFVDFPSSGTTAEQLVGRTHRAGQQADEVGVTYYGHTGPAKKAVQSALTDARYIEATTGTPQRLAYGTWVPAGAEK
jgi:hypothetical protein